MNLRLLATTVVTSLLSVNAFAAQFVVQAECAGGQCAPIASRLGGIPDLLGGEKVSHAIVDVEKCSALPFLPFRRCVEKEVISRTTDIKSFLASEKKSAFVLVAFTPITEDFHGVTAVVTSSQVRFTSARLVPIRADGKGAELSLANAVTSTPFFLDTDLRIGESQESLLLPARHNALTLNGDEGRVGWWGYGVLAPAD